MRGAPRNGGDAWGTRDARARQGAELPRVGAVVLGVDLAAAAGQVEQDDVEVERARVDLREVHVLLDGRREPLHREEREAEDGVVPQARREDARQGAESPPGTL